MAFNLRSLGGSLCTAALVLAVASPAFARVPLPKPRPADADATERKSESEQVAAQPSACRLALTDEIAIAPSLPPIKGPGACGGDDIVRLEAVVLPDKSRVALKPAATLRCPMAAAVAEWVRSDVVAIAAEAGTSVRELDNFDSFDCRGRNRVAGARLSEHGRANALDVRGVKFADGRFVSFTDRTVVRDLRAKFLASLCARFTTVLGPGSDWYHEDHIHLDLIQRRSGYRICQWDIWDPLPRLAPLLPAARPEEAPPREIAQENTKGEGEAARAQPEAKQPARQRDSQNNKKGAGKAGASR